MAENPSQLSTEELRGKLTSALAIQRTVAGIFALIVLAWIVLGFWRSNTPVFIATLAMGAASIAATSAAPRAIRAELARRESGA